MTSGGASIISATASCRSCVAEQIVPKDRKWVAACSSPKRSTMASWTFPPIASDSLASIVVWFATPTSARSTSGSKPGEAFSRKCSTSSSRERWPSRPVM